MMKSQEVTYAGQVAGGPWCRCEVASGRVRQITASPATIVGRAVKFTLGNSVGYVFQNDDGANVLYLFLTRPKTPPLPTDAPVLVAKYQSVESDELDLTEGTWVTHPTNDREPLSAASVAAASRKSWLRAFHFAEEDPRIGSVGLRKPQAGALHAIHAHWSTSGESATVVMPTGTGKTETMLAVLTSASCERVLVVVPTDALRSQIADKFETLGLLKVPGNVVLAEKALRPVVGTLTSKPKTIEEVDSVFLNCNVVVTTSHLVGLCEANIQDRMATLCTHLFIDDPAPAYRASAKRP